MRAKLCVAAALSLTALVARGDHHTTHHTATGHKWAVATVQPVATDAAMAVFRDGGNAVDAALCAAMTLGVVDNHNSGLGGGCLILIRSPDGDLIAIDGRETAPAASHRGMFLRDGVADTGLSQTGPLAVGTPGALAAYAMASEAAGRLPLARLLAPGERAARDGFEIDANYADRLAGAAETLRLFPASAGQLLDVGGQPHPEGYRLKQPDLAKTYRSIAEHGPDWFYRGPLAERVGAWMAANGGLLTANDFAAYEAKRREPIRSAYRGLVVVGFPPPSSGGVHVAQMLGILERFDLAQLLSKDRPRAVHVIAEAMKLAFADRAHWLGDSDFAEVPRGLLDPDYVKGLSAKIDPQHASDVPTHGEPAAWRQDLFGRHTTHIAAADAEGWWVAITATVNTGFGSKVIVPGTGLVLNNEMDDFSIEPGVPNAFGLIGAENNSVEPGKRPLSSMSPTIVLREDGEPLLTVGAAGGPKIITQVLLAIVGVVDGRLSLGEAIAAPRWHHQWRPDVLSFEDSMPTADALTAVAYGHQSEVLSSGGVSQGVQRLSDGRLTAVRDPRVPGKAAAE